jgi:iron complex outermembrane recepter protein
MPGSGSDCVCKMRRRRRPDRTGFLPAAAAGLALLASLPVSSSEAAPAARTPVLEEVIVTARRYEESLQEVPISVSVLSTLELERLQIHDLTQLQYVTPNLSVAPGQTTGASASIAIRGQYESDTTPTVDPAVGLYLDGVYFARMTGANLDLIDVERVEVLRGPQGTLFGRNTIGGAISIVPTHPTPEFAASLSAEIGNYDRQKYTGIVNAPLFAGQVETRLTAMHSEHGGYAHDPLLDVDLASEDTDFARLQFQFRPASNMLVHLAADYSNIKSGSQIRSLFSVAPGFDSIPGMMGNPGDRLSNYKDPFGDNVPANRAGAVHTTVWGTAGTVTVDLAQLTFKSITAWRALESRATDSDQDGTPYDLGVIFDRADEQHQFSQELQLFGNALDERLRWIGGLLYFDENAIFKQRAQVFVPATRTFNENRPWGDVSNQSLAAYAQASYSLTPRVSVTAGVRYNEDRRQLTSHNARRVGSAEVCRISPILLDQPGTCTATLPTRSFQYAPFTVGVEFRPDQSKLLYAKVSRGYRAGGYNIRGTDAVSIDSFEPEDVDSYEIGTKSDLLGDRLRVNLALFHTQFDNIQLVQRESLISQAGAPRFISNGGKAGIDGGELELVALLGSLRLTGGLGVTHAQFTELDPRVEGVTLDSKFMLTPGTTASIAADLPIAMGFGALHLHADYSWRDDVWFGYDRASPARQEANGLLNAMLTANFVQTGLQVSLWGRNITDQGYATRMWENDYYVGAAPGNPRTYGITVSMRFDASGVERRSGNR